MQQADRYQASLTEDGRYRLLVEGITDYAIYMLSPSGMVSSWNPGAQRFKGYTAAEIIGRHFSTFYSAEDQAAGTPARALETAVTMGKYESEGWRMRKDGTRFWAFVVIDPIRSEAGELVGFAKITRDLTEQREARNALEQAREALFQAQKMEAIGQFTGGVAHDFNNLLTAVLGSLEMLRKRLPNDVKMLALLDNAVMGARRGAALTQRMLAFARRQDLQLEPIDLPRLVTDMSDLLEKSLGPTFHVDLRFPPRLSNVLTDANQLELALLNLVVNARDAMPGGGTIIVAAQETDSTAAAGQLQPGRYVCLSVTDTGAGMNAETLARAAEPFFTTKDVGKGTGLGLPMVHGVAEQSGGRLLLKSRENAGTTAELWLPVAMDHHVSKTRQPAVDLPSSTRQLIVLAVDDDRLVLSNTVAMLEDLGHTVLDAQSAKQALEILKKADHIDLVITDHAMPDMTGAQLAESIRAARPELPIILATGYAVLPHGIAETLTKLPKPFVESELARAVASAVGNARVDTK